MKNKKILLVIIIFFVLVLVAFAGVYAYITLDVFRTPKQLFAKYLDKQIEQVESMNSGAQKTITENLKSAPSKTEYSMNIQANYYGTEFSAGYKQTLVLDPENFAGMLKLNATLENIEGESDLGEELSELPLEVMNYTFYGNKDDIIFKIPELNEKYFSIKIDTILEKAQELLKENDFENIELSKESIEKYKNDFKTLYNKYLEEVKAKFTDDKFSVDRKIEVDVNGTKLTANKYTFTISNTELQTIAVELLTKISEEPILSDFMTEEEISNFKDAIPNLSNDEEVINFKICVYENSGNTVKVELQSNDEILAEIMTTKVSDSETNLIANIINKKESDFEVGRVQTVMYSVNSENENTSTSTITSSTTYEAEDIEALKEYYEENNYLSYTDEMIDETYKNETTTETIKTTLNGNTATSQITFSGDNEEESFQISDAKIEYEFGITPDFNDLDNTINMEDYLEDEQQAELLVMQCIQNLQNNPNTLLGIIYNIFASASNPVIDSSNLTTEDDDNELSLGNSMLSFSDKTELEELVSDGLNSCLESYQRDLQEDPNVNVADYLTINKISEMILNSNISNLEMIDGSTLKCEYKDEIYYIKVVLNGETLKVDAATAYTESEYQEL